mgnify:CR=1 FL=1
MKRWRGLALGTLTAVLLSAPFAEAAEDTAKEPAAVQEPAGEPQVTSLADRMESLHAAERSDKAAAAEEKAAAKAEKKAQKAAARAEKKAAKEAAKREKAARYKTLFEDNGFTYYMDSQNTRWIPRPYRPTEQILDVWVRLVENHEGEPAAEDGKIRPAKYFLEHYYISPSQREIMFISELEVTGRPENAVKERPYDPNNWEHLVPGSIEDSLFEAITARVKQPGKRGGILSGTSGMSARDMVEEYARISL